MCCVNYSLITWHHLLLVPRWPRWKSRLIHAASLCYLYNVRTLFSCKVNERCRCASPSAMACLFPECRHGHPGKTDPCNSRGSCRDRVRHLQLLVVSYETPKRIWGSCCRPITLCCWPMVTNIRFYFRKISMVIWLCWHQLVWFFFGVNARTRKIAELKGEGPQKYRTKNEEVRHISVQSPRQKSNTLKKPLRCILCH